MAKALVEVEIPDGWEFVRYGIPGPGDFILDSEGRVVWSEVYLKIARIIVKQTKT
jgi:hypothetical protein